MTRFNLTLLAIVLSSKYEAILQYQASTLTTAQAKAQGRILLQRVLYKLQDGDNVIESAIFDKFRGSCVKPGEGRRSPDEFCGSAKAIACFAPRGHHESVFDSVPAAVMKVLRSTYANQSPEVQAAMVYGVDRFCPDNRQDWVAPFQDIMLAWEQREHPRQYKVMPNCLALDQGGI
ncbi:hypothetical protein BG000_000129 [Podila horticola]|nr:hypothetical protein BG000_000129 [Podila horticola]